MTDMKRPSREEAEEAARLAAPTEAPAEDIIGGDEFDTMIVDTPESRED